VPARLSTYASEITRLANSATSTEQSFYPAIKALLSAILSDRGLPFDVRVNTSERRQGGGNDLPDLALYDESGRFPLVCGEVKLIGEEIADMAGSTERNDQVGRYLAGSRVVLLSNIRSFGLLTVAPTWVGSGPVPPTERRLEFNIDLWRSADALIRGDPVDASAFDQLANVVEASVTRYASITEPESLARILAWHARQAKACLPDRFSDAVRGLLDDFGRALGVTFDGEDGEEFFRSSLIQTAYYGLFAGWVLWHRAGAERPFRWEDLSEYLRIPFLGELFHEFRHPTRIRELRLAKHLDLATEVLGRVVTGAFFARFRPPTVSARAEGTEHETASSAILYFYEPFLEAFDPELRQQLGVWYTPVDIVRYQARRIDHLLRTELGCDRGFADERVVVLDPCCGTGAYLLEVLRCIAEQLRSEGDDALLGAKLRDAFCRRIMGFEILTAPFVISQLQLYLILSELGAPPDPPMRPAVFLTNALTGWNGSDQLKLNFPELQQEHDAARSVKSDARIIVVLGNPPYYRFASVPMEEEADLVDHYKGIKRDSRGRQVGNTELFTRWGVRKHLLDDLYIRFFRLAEARIGERAPFGIVSFISNSSYLTGRSHPIMRESLLRHFHRIWIDNLHGNRLASERTPWGDSCETVFNTPDGGPGIKVGTSISTFLKRAEPIVGETAVFARDFWGRAEDKRRALLEALSMDAWSEAERMAAVARPEGPRPYEPFQPQENGGWKLVPRAVGVGYEDWPALDELFPVAYQGVNPNRGLEGSLIDTDKASLEARMRDYFSRQSFEEFCRAHPVVCEARAGYDPQWTREALAKRGGFSTEKIHRYLLFPLDLRHIYYEPEAKLLNRARPELWQNLSENGFLIAVPQPRRVSEARPLFTTNLFDLHVHDRGSIGFPLQVLIESSGGDLFSSNTDTQPKRRANLAGSVWEALRGHWNLRGDRDDVAAKAVTHSLFGLSLAVCHSPQYEGDNKDSLAQDWAHVPIPRGLPLLQEAEEAGYKVGRLLDPAENVMGLISELLGDSARRLAVPTREGGGTIAEDDLRLMRSFYGSARGDWRQRAPEETEAWRACWGESTGDLYVNDSVFFKNVPQSVWRYELGGYPVLKKWLGYRHSSRRAGNPLTLLEADHFRSMVQRIATLIVLMPDLDSLYGRLIADCFTLEELGLR
jgi:hypothetical protein